MVGGVSRCRTMEYIVKIEELFSLQLLAVDASARFTLCIMADLETLAVQDTRTKKPKKESEEVKGRRDLLARRLIKYMMSLKTCETKLEEMQIKSLESERELKKTEHKFLKYPVLKPLAT